MDKCPNCGNKINRMDVLCPRCGAVVEDVQVKNSVKVKQSSNSDIALPIIPKKNFQQNFVVYNEDFPSEEDEMFGGAAPDGKTPVKTDIDDFEYEQPDAAPDEEERDYYVPAGMEVPYDETEYETGYNEPGIRKQDTLNPDQRQNNKDSLDEEAYSERYLERIKGLPEIDDISSFDPEEYMKKYKLSKSMYGNIPVGTVPESIDFNEKVTKHYLEIEEIIPPKEGELPKALPDTEFEGISDTAPLMDQTSEPEVQESGAEVTASGSEIPEQSESAKSQEEKRYELDEVLPIAPPYEHRYNPGGPHRYRKDKSRRSKQEDITEKRTSEEIKPAVRSKRRRRMPAVAALLIWIVVIGGLFAGFFFFDRYVKAAYGNYGSFIYSITDGRIDFGSGAQAK